ncbi:flagellar motor switch protein FliM [Alicyclobacillus ferrooxydans]|uniref:Flagellar motor switch protein FliM n=1 Tax=Alicyclobacillus ferrooxydans TaxID=471514 RepID=A0A0P9GTA5_9BACL|nr:flagellar motor switch protein FliM [Alicyclobacillus ferrooxydans]KPV44383.1 hypothetical protein AN477_07065 [Alicyclobacillus ferrooxydans]
MSKVLSQEEIDHLLASVHDGTIPSVVSPDVSEQRFTTYDFRRALHFSKDHFRVIRRVFEQFARQFSNRLGARLRTVTSMQVESVDELPYEEFMASIPRLTVLQVMELHPLQGRAALEMNMQLAFAMLDFFMGGSGQHRYVERELTDIENKLLGNVLSEMKPAFSEAWAMFLNVRPVFNSIECNPHFVQIATPNESVLVVTMQMKVGDTTGLVNMCIPYIILEDIVPKLTARSYYTTSKTENSELIAHEGLLARHVRNSSLKLSVLLGTTPLPMKEVLDLEQGDVITLDQSIHAPLTLFSDGVPIFLGNIGLSKSHFALKISEAWKDVTENE